MNNDGYDLTREFEKYVMSFLDSSFSLVNAA